jgi:pimeloyl-ACP methyl ester carboxylesterase
VVFDREEVEDLRRRLRSARWPEHETVHDWSQGVPLRFAQDLAEHWCDRYDFTAAEGRLNAWPQFMTSIDGLDIHFVHARSPHADALPLVITHGWPGTYVEFLDVIGPLTDPASYGGTSGDAFHVVCPSLPGYGFSGKPMATGCGIGWIAKAWSALMRRLGYTRYGAQGGDWGSAITCALADLRPSEVLGIHLNMPSVPLPPPTEDASERERQAFADYEWHAQWGTGYQIQQSTRPQTLGYGLVDSPVAQLAWVVEKFWAWTDCEGDPYTIFTREQLLDNISVYWFTATGASSARLYWEGATLVRGGPNADPAVPGVGPVSVPTGCSVFPREIRRPSRRQAEVRFQNVHWWNEPARGGHFAAFEQPALFVDEVRSAFRPLRGL